MKIEIKDKGDMYIDETLYRNLMELKKRVLEMDWDYFCVIAGIPGVGKSTLAQQIATFFDNSFCVDRVCFSAKEYIKKSCEMKKGQAIVLDESFADMNTNVTRSPEFAALMNQIQAVRQKNLFHILVLPDFFSLNKNIAIFRTNHLFVVYHDDGQRGRYAVFDRESKRELYVKGKKEINYQIVPPNIRGRFVNKWFIDYDEYKRRKEEHLKQLSYIQEERKGDKQRNILIWRLVRLEKRDETEVGSWIGLAQQTISGIVVGLDKELGHLLPKPAT